MALFSRRKKSEGAPDTEVATDKTVIADSIVAEEAPVEAAPAVEISVQAFRGMGAQAGPAVTLPDADDAPAAPQQTQQAQQTQQTAPAAPLERKLPLAAELPPEQTETVTGMKDNVLLREALKEVLEGATNDQLLGVMRQTLQGHLYLRVQGDAREQMSQGLPLSVGVIRDGEQSFMLAYSSAGALRESVLLESDPAATSAVAQPTINVLQQVVAGGFTGLIIDHSSAPHRVVFPTELLQKSVDQADPDMTIKTILAAPRDENTALKVGEALAKKRVWVAVNDGTGSGEIGVAEARTADGKRFLQVFSHPLEVVVLGRGDRPMPFEPAQLAKLLSEHAEISGVVVDTAGPTLVLERNALAPVIVLAVNVGE